MLNGLSTATAERTITVALVGNPNTGKSTLFSALAGIHQRVGNYPGVTVEKKTGRMDFAGRKFELVDLPGLYSLSPRSRDEMVAVDVLLGRALNTGPVDVVLCIADASNLERNLYLLSQVLELGLPTVVALNMLDVAESQGTSVRVAELSRRLGTVVVPTQAHKRVGTEQLKKALAEAVGRPAPRVASPLPSAVVQESAQLEAMVAERMGLVNIDSNRLEFLTRRILLGVGGYLESTLAGDGDDPLLQSLAAARGRLAAAGCEAPGVETTARYDWARRMVEGGVCRTGRHRTTASDRIDRVLTHRLWGTLILLVVMFTMFQAVFSWAKPPMEWITRVVDYCGSLVESYMAEGALRSLLVDGVIRGVGGVLAFLPQIAILFFFIAILEDSGYLARGAYLMDKLMVRVGLSGRSFVPMLSSFACAVPGIMAARVVENQRDRFTTILVAPLLTCSARLPVYALLIAAFVPARNLFGGLFNLQGLTLAALYALGIVTAVLMALLLKRTLFRGDAPLFLLELPSYKWPSLRTAVFRVVERAMVFLRCAGTLILLVSILVWAAMYYPHHPAAVVSLSQRQAELQRQLAALDAHDASRAAREGQLKEIETQVAVERHRNSILGYFGRFIEPAVQPLGWDWRIGCAVIASFPAREVVVATLGVIFNNDEQVDTESAEGTSRLQTSLHAATWDGSQRPLFTLPVALSLMVFFALCAQCAATLAIIRRETNSWRWPIFTFSYMTGLAYVAAFVTYQFSTWMSLG